ncbi:hypothetical protein [Planococcus lenghuensis]|uniref:hypothetical protein n=1 Tax=Planococcus lenghuensis TaxID=2213202 RepID=UPI0012EC3923|nr:hypothetical protein [Planococcus lenghuensis]
MDLLIKLFGGKNEDSCCAIEIKEVKREEALCCADTRGHQAETADAETETSPYC